MERPPTHYSTDVHSSFASSSATLPAAALHETAHAALCATMGSAAVHPPLLSDPRALRATIEADTKARCPRQRRRDSPLLENAPTIMPGCGQALALRRRNAGAVQPRLDVQVVVGACVAISTSAPARDPGASGADRRHDEFDHAKVETAHSPSTINAEHAFARMRSPMLESNSYLYRGHDDAASETPKHCGSSTSNDLACSTWHRSRFSRSGDP